MKKQIFFSFWSLLILTVVATSSVRGQTTSVASPLQYPGSQKKADVVVSQCDAIFVGNIIYMGPVVLTEPATSYQEYNVKVTALLKGTLPTEIQAGVKVKNNRQIHEITPQVGESYIFFGKLRWPKWLLKWSYQLLIILLPPPKP